MCMWRGADHTYPPVIKVKVMVIGGRLRWGVGIGYSGGVVLVGLPVELAQPRSSAGGSYPVSAYPLSRC